MMNARDLIDVWVGQLTTEQQCLAGTTTDQPIAPVGGRLVQTVGTLYLYEIRLPEGSALTVDTPLSIVPSDETEPAEGIALSCRESTALVQTFESLGPTFDGATIIPDRAGLLQTYASRLKDMLTQADAYRLGPADRLAPMLEAGSATDTSSGSSSSILATYWANDPLQRRQTIATMIVELIRANKRVLLISHDHHGADELAGTVARAMKAGGLTYRTWMSRYEMSLAQQASGLSIQELGFEAQMHQFYSKSRADKAALRRKYERFRELTPLLAHKAQKQKDLDEVRLLEWRLLTQLGELQAKTKEAETILTEYESLPLLRRLSMQAVGKNVDSLHQYIEIYRNQMRGLTKELDIAKARISALVPEAAVPKDLRPEFEELKEDIVHLGGTKKIRELLAAEENTNRQAFIQNRRLVITTAARVLGDSLFSRVRFDVLIADNAPWISAPGLLGAAGLVRERIVLTGDRRDINVAGQWAAT